MPALRQHHHAFRRRDRGDLRESRATHVDSRENGALEREARSEPLELSSPEPLPARSVRITQKNGDGGGCHSVGGCKGQANGVIVPFMHNYTYSARAIYSWPQDSGSACGESVVYQYRGTSKRGALEWILIMMRYGNEISFFECWNDNPDDAWKVRVACDADGADEIRRELEAVTV